MIQIRATVVCDTCGATIEGKVGTRTTSAWEAPSSAKDKAFAAGWIETDHGRYYPRRHFCPACQDKPMPKLKRPPAPKPDPRLT